MNHLNKSIVGALLVSALSFHVASFAQAGSNPPTNTKGSKIVNAKGARIVGVWDVTVSVYNCTNGEFLVSFPALHKYELGGTGQVVPAGNTTLASAHMAVWESLGDNQYSTALKFFRYHNGAPVGSTVISSEVWTDQTGMEYGGSGVAELYDLDGNFMFVGGCPSFEGTRFTGGQ